MVMDTEANARAWLMKSVYQLGTCDW
ncbi:unnamed protein product [Lathyrus oleraceus]